MHRPSHRETRYSRWGAAAAFVLLAGLAGSVLTANAVAANRDAEVRHRFQVAASDVAAQLNLALQRQNDLAAHTAAQVAIDPASVTSTFASWTASARVMERHPEVSAVGIAVPATPSSLATLGRNLPGGLVVTPAGHRPVYCLALAGVTRPGAPEVPVGTDFCAGPLRTALLAARDSGVGSYDPLELEGRHWLGVQTPFYRGGSVPSTVAERRRLFAGWAGMAVDATALLNTAVVGHDVSISLRHQRPGAVVVFSSGGAPREGLVDTTDLGNGWTVRTVGADLPGGVLSLGLPLAFLVAGTAISVLLAAVVLLLATGRARAVRLVQQRTGELRHQALHDALTGLPNRALLLDRVQQALARAHRSDTPLAVMFLDLDGFKSVNDMYGHNVGDQLLQAVSLRLTSVLRETDTVARLGGDEFVILAEGPSLFSGPEAIAERVQAVLNEPFHLNGHESIPIRTHASIGIAAGVRGTADELLRDADVALYEAKAAGKDCYVTFEPEMHTAVQDRLELETDLRDAIGTDQLFLVYQPTVDLQTEAITGVEALLRWQHPTRGLVMPDVFIPLAEETGLIVAIGRQVLTQACAQVAAWQHPDQPLNVAVNVSGRQLDSHHDLVSDVRRALDLSGLPAAHLTLEITETMLMRDADRSAQQLRDLKQLGVRIAIDDFGTGYCSLAYLQQFPVDSLKIDRSFITGLTDSPDANALIHTLVQLGKRLGIETYAEGIELRSQLQHLKQEQCDSGQGYLFARPLPPSGIEELLGRPNTADTVSIPRQVARRELVVEGGPAT